MTNTLMGLTALLVLFSMSTPASAITAEVAKKCRELAIKEHPYQLPGTKANYAEAERQYFRSCVSKETTKQK